METSIIFGTDLKGGGGGYLEPAGELRWAVL